MTYIDVISGTYKELTNKIFGQKSPQRIIRILRYMKLFIEDDQMIENFPPEIQRLIFSNFNCKELFSLEQLSPEFVHFVKNNLNLISSKMGVQDNLKYDELKKLCKYKSENIESFSDFDEDIHERFYYIHKDILHRRDGHNLRKILVKFVL